MALINQKLKYFNEAIKYYEKVIEINKSHFETYNNLGLINYELKHYDLAKKFLKKAFQLNPNYLPAIHNLGTVFMENKNILESLKCFRLALKLNNSDPEIYNNLAQIYKKLNNYNLSKRFYKKAISLKKKDLVIFSNYIYLLALDPDTSEEEYLNEAKNINYDYKVSNINYIKHRADKQRIGFVSSDLKKHPVGFFCRDTIKELSKKYEIYCYNNSYYKDSISNEIKNYCTEWIDIYNLSTEEAKNQIQKKNLLSI